MIQFEKEAIQYLRLPSMPKKKWDGKQSFRRGIAVLNLVNDEQGYAIASFDSETQSEPQIIKVFSLQMYTSVDMDNIYIVPEYMDTKSIDEWDVDEASKRAAQAIVEEGNAMIGEGDMEKTEVPENEYFFDFIHNDEEAIGFLKAQMKKRGKAKSKVPTTHDDIVTLLASLWMESNSKEKKGKKK